MLFPRIFQWISESNIYFLYYCVSINAVVVMRNASSTFQNQSHGRVEIEGQQLWLRIYETRGHFHEFQTRYQLIDV